MIVLFRETIVATLVVCMFAAPLLAEDLYTRPLSACANNGDGTSYQCAATAGAAGAYRGFGNVLYGSGAGKVSTGDTLYICGRHDGGSADATLIPTVDATLDGNCPYDPGTIIAAYLTLMDGWFGPDVFGVYSQNPASGCPWHMAQLMSGVPVYLNKKTGMPDKTWIAGDWSQPGGCSTTYYVKPWIGSSANDVTLYTNINTILTITNVRVAIRNLQIWGLTQDYCVKFTNADGSSLRNTTMKNCAESAVGIYNTSDDLEITDNDISMSGNGIYIQSTTTADNSNRVLIARNRIHDLDQARFFHNFTPDAHGIGIQGGDDVMVVNNDIQHIPGSCVTFYTFPGQSLKRFVLAHNYCEDVNDISPYSKLNQDGYEVGSTNAGHEANDVVNNVMIGNTAKNVAGNCIKIKPSHATVGQDMTVMGNILIQCGSGLRFYDDEDGDVGFIFKHNRLIDNVRHIEHIEHGTDDLIHVDIDYNTYYPDGVGKFEWNGAISNFSTFQVNSFQDSHSTLSD